MTKLFIFLIICFICTLLPAQPSDLKFKHIGSEQGLSQENINDIVQDYKGYIWMATSDGLIRYDGKTLKTYRNQYNNPNSLSFNWIWDLLPLKNGDLIIGTRKGLNVYQSEPDLFTKLILKDSTEEFNINQVEVDSRGNLWVATWGNGVFVLDSSYKLIRTITTETVPALSSNNVGRIAIEQESKYVWFGTWAGLDCLKEGSKELIHFNSAQEDITGDKIISLIVDPNGGVWYGTSTNGYGYLNASTGEKKLFSQLPEGGNVVTSLAKDDKGRLWVGTYTHGLYVLDANGQLDGHYKSDIGDPFSLVSNTIQALFIDEQGSVWIGNKGLSVYQEIFNQFAHLRTSFNKGLINNTVWAFEEDEKGRIYIATENGLSRYNPEDQIIQNFIPINQGFSFRIIYSMEYDSSGKIWLGTDHNILCYFDIDTETFVEVDPVLTDPAKPLKEDINAMALWDGVLWLGTYQKGLFRYNIASNTLEAYENKQIETKNWASFYLEDQKYLWLCSIGDGVYKMSRKDSVELHLRNEPNSINCISNSIVRCITKSNNGAYWIGTSSGLNYYLPSRDTIIRFYEHKGLPNNYICGILEDSRGDIWVSTNSGLSNISLPGFQFTNFDYSNGLQGSSFNDNAFFKSSKDVLFFGGKGGVTYFEASAIRTDHYAGKTNISTFQVQGNSGNLLTGQPRIILNHNQNFFSISFMISNYVNTEKNKFQYQLIGIDQDWINTNSTQVNYTNVSSGKYIFQVIGMNGDGVKSSQLAELEILIRKPWYFSVGFVSLYVLVLMLLGFLAYKSLMGRKKLRADLLAKDQEKEKLIEMDHFRSELLSNISHEIRTPLNLILSPIDLLRNKVPDAQKNKLLSVISWNAHRLLTMVNQILDLSRLDAHKLELTKNNVYLGKILEPILNTFQSYAINEAKIFRWSIPEEPLIVSVDVEMFEKIIINLLSNAFKFSGEEGEVKFSASLFGSGENTLVKITVTDNGIGISQEEQEKVFSRFYTSKSIKHQGIGIGLALTKQLVEMHGGKIEVNSEPDKFTSFEVYLPICAEENTQVNDLQSTTFKAVFLPEGDMDLTDAELAAPSQEKESKDIKLLTVEDDRGLREILVNLLQDRYTVLQAGNGAEAFKQIEKLSFDLIITDLVMPGMDGMEFIRQLKSKHKTINIPIIVLSARISEEGKLAAMQLGVDAFMDKPFNNKELLTKIENILQLRIRLKEAIRSDHLLEKSKALNVPGDYDVFIKQVEEIIQRHLHNAQFSVGFLSDQLAMSRVQLYRKVKAITGSTVSEFIRNYRLQLAAQLILSGKTRMTEIALEVGFNNPSYFAEQFKKLFGCNPSEYKNKHT